MGDFILTIRLSVFQLAYNTVIFKYSMLLSKLFTLYILVLLTWTSLAQQCQPKFLIQSALQGKFETIKISSFLTHSIPMRLELFQSTTIALPLIYLLLCHLHLCV